MDYRKMGEAIYLRIDPGEEIAGSILAVCRKEQIESATFSGIGGCDRAEIQTLIPEDNHFHTHSVAGMLEMVSLLGNISSDDKGEIYLHAHAIFSYLDEKGSHQVIAGHLKETTVRYTAEIEIRPVQGVILRQHDKKTGIDVWKL